MFPMGKEAIALCPGQLPSGTVGQRLYLGICQRGCQDLEKWCS